MSNSWRKISPHKLDDPLTFDIVMDMYDHVVFYVEVFYFLEVDHHQYVWLRGSDDNTYFRHHIKTRYDEWKLTEYKKLPDKVKKAIIKEEI